MVRSGVACGVGRRAKATNRRQIKRKCYRNGEKSRKHGDGGRRAKRRRVVAAKITTWRRHVETAAAALRRDVWRRSWRGGGVASSGIGVSA